jgi:signal transduction histidine kinase
VFEVADTGPGVSPEGQAHLFDRFWQERRTDRRGVGLGLPIAKGIVEAHHGRMWVESEPGAGSHFYFAIPAKPHPEVASVAA